MIYSNSERIALSEQSQFLTEGFTINKNPPSDFYKIASNIVDTIGTRVGSLPASKLTDKNRKMADAPWFSKSVSRSKIAVEKRKNGDFKLANMNSRFSVTISIVELTMGLSSGSRRLCDVVANTCMSNGFMVMKESKKFLKSLFQPIYLYKPLGDKSFMVMRYSINYMTYNGVFSGWTDIDISFKAVVNDEKALKALNIIESSNIDNSAQLFESVDFI